MLSTESYIMGNSQSYDVTNVHRNDKRHEQETTGTVKPLSDGMPPTLSADEREKQENTSPNESSPTDTMHSEIEEQIERKSEHVEHVGPPMQPVEEEHTQLEEQSLSEPTERLTAESSGHSVTDEAVKEVVQEMSEVTIETLERDIPPESMPLEAVPSQCSYNKLK
ncbi:unnamed protein product [Haemonchus placei]|uniref:Fibrous sheath-interacting protein 1 n=1 Tax=Haemonchus placei TaxID=6290 RepID=A0A0N4W9Q6_HAEPC|nr:unnamed protein product [Haemonchus placei]